jgi:hypothetical protein
LGHVIQRQAVLADFGHVVQPLALIAGQPVTEPDHQAVQPPG